MNLGIEGRVAIVAASSRGLGRASAMALAAEGAQLVISGRNEESLRETQSEIEAMGAQVIGVRCDVTEAGSELLLLDEALNSFGSADIVVANAGGPPPGKALEVSEAELSNALSANLLASARLVRAAVPRMKDLGWGRACAITSYSVVQALPGLALSNTSRAGLWAWLKTAAYDLAGSGVNINMVCPGRHATERMLELQGTAGGSNLPMGDPADFGKVVAFMCSEPARYLNGAMVVVDGGETLAL